MKLKLSLLSSLLIFLQITYCQNINDLIFKTKLKSTVVSVYKIPKTVQKYTVYFDTILIDTVNVLPNYTMYNYNTNQYVFQTYNPSTSKYDIYQLTLDNSPLKKILTSDNEYYAVIESELIGLEQNIKKYNDEIPDLEESFESGGMKTNEERITKLITYNMETKEGAILINIDSLNLDIKPYEDIIDIIVSDDKILIELGLFETGEYLNTNYLIYDLNTHHIKFRNYKGIQNIHKSDIAFNIIRLRASKHKIYCKDYIFTNNYLLDKDFNVLTPILKKSNNLFYFCNNNKLNTTSNTDSTKNKWSKNRIKGEFKFDVNPALENVFYKLYFNIEISEDTLSQLSLNEIIMLKNFIYAKHNSSFKDITLQKLYNTFEFYDDAYKYRVSEIELNNIDKTNLNILQHKIK